MKRNLFTFVFIFLLSGLFAETITLFSVGLNNRKSYSISSADFSDNQVHTNGNTIYINSSDFTITMNHRITDKNDHDWFNFHFKQGHSPSTIQEVKKFKVHPKHKKTYSESLSANVANGHYIQFHVTARYKDGDVVDPDSHTKDEYWSPVYYIAIDTTPPSNGTISLSESPTILKINRDFYYFRPAQDIPFNVPTCWDGESGPASAYKSLQYYTNHWFSDNNYTYEGLGSTILARLVAWDNLSNTSVSNTVKLEADGTPPQISISSPGYSTATDNSKFAYNYTYNVSDSQSGVRSRAFSVSGNAPGYFVEDTTEEYQSNSATITLPNYNRDYLYRYKLTAEDRVTNSSDSGYSYIGLTRGPVYDGDGMPSISISEEEEHLGEYLIQYNMLQGRYFADNTIGYKSLTSYLGSTPVVSLDSTELHEKYTGLTSEPDPILAFPDVEGEDPPVLPFSFSAFLDKESFSPHSRYRVYTTAAYHNGYEEDSEAFNDPFYLTLPNKALHEGYNDLSFQFYRDGYLIEDWGLGDFGYQDGLLPEDASSSLYYADSFQLKVVGETGVPGIDEEGDELYLEITTASDGTLEPIPCFKGVITFTAEGNVVVDGSTVYEGLGLDDITSVRIKESYEETDQVDGEVKTVSNYYPLNLTIGKDEDLQADFISAVLSEDDTVSHTWTSGQVVATNDGTFHWSVRFGSVNDDGSVNNDFYDQSGIQQIAFFEYDPAVEVPDYDDFMASENVESLSFGLTEADQYDPSQTYLCDFPLEAMEEGQAERRNIGVYVQDFAGNYKIITQKVYYDRAVPQPLDPVEKGGVIRWSATQDDNLQYYDFDTNDNRIILSLDLSEVGAYGSLEACTIEASSSSPYLVSDNPIAVNATQSRIILALAEDFPSDEEIDLTLTFTDYAGNVRENHLVLYAPFYFPDGAVHTSYLKETEREWDDEAETNLGHYLGWTQIGQPGIDLVLYHDYEPVSVNDKVLPGIDGLGDFIDGELIAHGEYAYYLHGKNRSGYESKFAEGEIAFSRSLKNNNPVFSFYEAEGSCEYEGESYIGPLNNITIGFTDYDETDDFALKFYVNGEEYTVEEISGSAEQQYFLNVSDYFPDWADDQVYTIGYEILDHWGIGEEAEEGLVADSAVRTYRYDNRKPDLAGYRYDKREGFRYIYGGIHLNIEEEGSGLVSRSLLEEAEGELVEQTKGLLLSDGDDLEGYTHVISQIPEIEDYTLYLRIEDGVGNINTKQIGPFSRDETPPSITDAAIDSASEYFSRPTVPLRVEWSDNLSGAGRVVYRFTEGTEVLKTGEVSPAEEQMGSALWSVLCSLSGTQVTDSGHYGLQVKILDNAGNGRDAAWKPVSSNIRIDSSSPVVKITGQSGFHFNLGQYYLGDWGSAELSSEVSDANPTGEVRYELDDHGVISRGDNLTTLLSGLSDGEVYSVRVGTRDKADNTGWSDSFSFVSDRAAPDSSTFGIVITNNKDFTRGEQVRFTFHAEDEHSGIEKYYLWVGKTVEGEERPVLTELLPGHLEDGSIPMAYTEGKTYCLNLPEAEEGNYFFKVSAVDYSGNRTDWKVLGGETLSYVESSESLAVNDYSVYTNNAGSLSAWWEYKGEKEFNHYAYRVIDSSDNQPVSDWEYTFDQYGTVSFPDGLSENGIYYFEVYAGYGDGSRSASSYSPGCYIDLNAPVLSSVSVPSYGTLADLKVSWEAEDGESAIGSVTAVLETYQTDGEGQIVLEHFEQDGVSFTLPIRQELGAYSLASEKQGKAVQVLRKEEFDALDIADGQKLLLSLRVSDLAGNVAETEAPVFIKDSSAPPVPVVLDDGEFINPEKNAVRFDWTWSQADPHSGNVSYDYQILLPSDSLNDENWTSIEGTACVLPDPEKYANGSQIVFALRASNGAGLQSIGYSNGIVLDNTKPAIADVKLLGTDHEEVLYLLGLSANLSMVSEDDQSGVSRYRYEPGVFNGTDWVSLGEEKEVLSSDDVLPVSIPGEVESLQVVYYRATAYNAAGESSSLPGYTAGAKYFEGIPLIENVIGESVNGGLRFLWDVEDLVPLSEITLNLVQNGSVVRSVTLAGDAKSYQFDNLADGFYQLQMDYRAVNQVENGEAVSSGLVCLDTTAPEARNLDYTRFVNDLFRYSFSITDNLTGAGGYRYRIGPAGSPDLLTEGWLWNGSTGAYQEKTVSFEEDFAGGYDSLEDGGTLLFSFQVKDRSGNWSEIAYSRPILVDRTAPDTPVVDMDRQIQAGETLYTQSAYFIHEEDRITGLAITGEDSQSGIAGYRWALRKEGGSEDLLWSDILAYHADEDDKTILLNGVDLNGLALDDKVNYEVYIQLVNGSGILSDAGVSPLLFADFSAPVFEVSTSTSGLGTEAAENGTGLIFNTSGDVNVKVLQEDGEVLKLTYSLISPEDVESEETSLYYLGADVTDLTVPFLPEDEELYGPYKLKIVLSDAGGFSNTVLQDIRLNSPPDLALQNLVARPMEPFRLDFSDWVKDLDTITSLSVTLEHGDETDEWVQSSVSDLTGLAYDHSELFAGQSEYVYHVTAIDEYGQQSTAQGLVTIVNTAAGTLYTDEYWTGTHQITGPVIVPEGLTLHVDNHALIQIVPLEGYGTALILIDSGGGLDHEGQATYELMDRTLDYLWEGLEIRGEADLNRITVKDARRGVTLFSDKVIEMKDSVFEDNLIGLHLFGTSPAITGCTFRDNIFYGIKEDDDSRPVLTNNQFTGNGYDYYDLDRTVLSAEETNALDGNTGNRGDN